MSVKFLVHHEKDNVGVAVVDIAAGVEADGKYRDQEGDLKIKLRDDVPLGHKIALVEIGTGNSIIEYGVVIGLATKDISVGQQVHVHNLKGQRWN
jgi:(2R)-sulfolactate sulfo-lyase subunit alpha